jgi:hypothetical protein
VVLFEIKLVGGRGAEIPEREAILVLETVYCTLIYYCLCISMS